MAATHFLTCTIEKLISFCLILVLIPSTFFGRSKCQGKVVVSLSINNKCFLRIKHALYEANKSDFKWTLNERI